MSRATPGRLGVLLGVLACTAACHDWDWLSREYRSQSEEPDGGGSTGGLTVLYRVNCGGSFLDDPELPWAEDSVASPSGHAEFNANKVETALDPAKGVNVPEHVPTALFELLRWFSPGSTGYLRYRFPRGPGAHLVRAYFVERAHESSGGRLFHVSLDGVRVLTNYDIYADVGATRTGAMKEWSRVYSQEGETVLELFFGAADAPVISGIEILRDYGE